MQSTNLQNQRPFTHNYFKSIFAKNSTNKDNKKKHSNTYVKNVKDSRSSRLSSTKGYLMHKKQIKEDLLSDGMTYAKLSIMAIFEKP